MSHISVPNTQELTPEVRRAFIRLTTSINENGHELQETDAQLAATQVELAVAQADIVAAQAEITEAQAEIVEQQTRLSETTQALAYTTGSPVYTSTSAGWQDWLSVGNVNVPTWAVGVVVVVTIGPIIFDVVGSDDIVSYFRVEIGSDTLDGLGVQHHLTGDGDVKSAVFGSVLSGGFAGSGSQAVVVQHFDSFADGNRWAATTDTVATFQFTFI